MSMELSQAIFLSNAGFARLALTPTAEHKRIRGTSGIDVVRGGVLVFEVHPQDAVAIVTCEPGSLHKFIKESQEKPGEHYIFESDDPEHNPPAPRRVFIAKEIAEILSSNLPQIDGPVVQEYSPVEAISGVRGVRDFNDPNIVG